MFSLKQNEILPTFHAKYEIVRPLGEGGRGQTYLALVRQREADAPSNVPAVGTNVVIKTVKIDEERGMRSISYFIDFVDRRLMEEGRALSKLKGLQCVAHYVDTGTFRVVLGNGEVLVPRFLVQEFIKGTVLESALPARVNSKDFTGIASAAEWFELSLSIVEALLAVHQRGVVHNDIWHKNIMLTEEGRPILIDFGEAIFRTARDLAYVDQPNRQDPWIAPEWNWTHMRPSRRADIFALGGVFFWMACGAEPPMPEPDIEKAKLDIEMMIRGRNAQILKENVAIADIVARCRRYDRGLRIADAEKLRRELLTYRREEIATSVVDSSSRLLERARSLEAGGRVFLIRMADILIRQTERQLEDMCTGVIDIGGGHEDLVSGCVDALASLKKGDEYLAVSTLRFWKPENIGVRGRFLSMTHLCAQRGVNIRRVFLLTEADQRDEHFWPILRAQIELQVDQDLERHLQTRFRFLRSEEFAERISRGDHCGFWLSGDQVMEIMPIYDGEDILRSIRLIISDVAPRVIHNSFAKDFEKAERLTLEALTKHLKA
jgi:serine/threonine protein kinase